MPDACYQNESDVTVPTICQNDIIPSEHPHEPPIGFDDGSLTISWDQQIVVPVQTPIPGDPRPNKYVLQDSTKYRGPIAVLRTVVERDDGKAFFTRYLLPRGLGARVLIWLQQLKGDVANPLDYEDLTSEPQIIITGDNFAMETDKPLAAFQNYKPHRMYGYQHPGYDRHFRIGGWAVMGSGGLVYENNNPFERPFRETGQDAYHLYISFHH